MNRLSKAQDIAILTLASPRVKFGPELRPLCLPVTANKNWVKTNPWVAGWGLTSIPGKEPTKKAKVLRYVQTTVVSKKKCDAKYPNLNITE